MARKEIGRGNFGVLFPEMELVDIYQDVLQYL